MTTVRVAVPRKGRPLEAVLKRLAERTKTTTLADEIISTLRYEKAVAKGTQTVDTTVYDRLAAYSAQTATDGAEYTLMRDSRDGFPRRIVFDSVTISLSEIDVQLVGREEPFRALRKHEFPLGFDSADLVLEEVVELTPEPLQNLSDVNDRINPRDTDVRLVSGLGDTVWHTLLATPSLTRQYNSEVTRDLVDCYEGALCISPRYERLVEAVLGTRTAEGIEFSYPDVGEEEEAAIAKTGIGVYLTVTGSTAREHGLKLGERLFPSETVLLENNAEVDDTTKQVTDILTGPDLETELTA